MNSYNNNKKITTKTTTTTKPFCKVCYDTGKNESVYTSHFVKDKQGSDGKVVCPYLLSLTCTFCKKSEGHTARHCPVLQKKIGQQDKHKQDKQGTQQQDKQGTQQQDKQGTQHKEEDDGWSKVISTSKSTKNAPVIINAAPVVATRSINVVLKSSKKTTSSSSTTGAAKYINTLATLMEQEEQRVINDEFDRVDQEVKRVKFDTDYPAFEKKETKITNAPAATLAPAAKEESCYGTYSITPISICWGDDADDY